MYISHTLYVLMLYEAPVAPDMTIPQVDECTLTHQHLAHYTQLLAHSMQIMSVIGSLCTHLQNRLCAIKHTLCIVHSL